MNTIKAFFKEKGRYLFWLALVFAATVAGVLALRTVLDAVTGYGNPAAGQEENTWPAEPLPPIENHPDDTTVNNPAENVPKNPAKTDAPTGSQPSSAASSSSGAPSPSGGASTTAADSAGSSAPQAGLPTSPWAAEPTAAFSGDELVYQQTLGDWRTHNGADYTATAGDPVRPVTAGTVMAAGQDALWGGVVEVAAADGTVWRYCGLQKIAVTPDEKVTPATLLGEIGTVPAEAHLGAHLHLECADEGVSLDPETKK